MKKKNLLKRLWKWLCLYDREIYFAAWVVTVLVFVGVFWSIYNFLGEIGV